MTVWLCFPDSGSQKSGSTAAPGLPIYVDLAYIPNHCSAKNVDQEFFKRIRSAYYVVSGNDAASGEPSRGVLDALLDGKAQWGSNLQVTLWLLGRPALCSVGPLHSGTFPDLVYPPPLGDPHPHPRHRGDP